MLLAHLHNSIHICVYFVILIISNFNHDNAALATARNIDTHLAKPCGVTFQRFFKFNLLCVLPYQIVRAYLKKLRQFHQSIIAWAVRTFVTLIIPLGDTENLRHLPLGQPSLLAQFLYAFSKIRRIFTTHIYRVEPRHINVVYNDYNMICANAINDYHEQLTSLYNVQLLAKV